MSGSRRLWRRTVPEVKREVEEEIRFHVEARMAELERKGYTAAQARAEAERRLGDADGVLADCVASDLRADRRERRREAFADVIQDARHGVRQLLRRPGFAAAAVLTLAVAIGLNAAIYAFADHVLVRPLPYAEPERVVTLWEVDLREPETPLEVSPANYLDWAAAARSFAALALAEPYSVDLVEEGRPPEAVKSWNVTRAYFDAIGARPILGRTFEESEHAPNGRAVTLLSYGFWQRRYGGDPGVIGQTVELDGLPTEVIGVLPPSLEYPEPRQVWSPKRFAESELTDRRSGFMYVVGRLAEGVTVTQAQAELDGIAARMAEEHAGFAGRSVAVVPLAERVLGGARPAVLALMGGVGVLLLIACANIANLLIARGLERRGELALRGALGAGRGRLVRQLVTEATLLSVVAGAAGTALAWAAIRVLRTVAPPDLPRLSAVALDGRVIVFLCLVTGAAAALFGLIPALRLSRPDLMSTLRAGRTGARHEYALRRTLVMAQIALCVILLVGAGLLGRSMQALLANPLGFETSGRATVQLFLWDRNPAPAQRIALVTELLERFRALPGVQDAAAVSALPFHPHSITAMGNLVIEGRHVPGSEEVPRVYTTIATPGYFGVMGIPLRSGRGFTELDRAGAPAVALISEALARRYFGGEDPIGRQVTIGVMAAPVSREIVGVVGAVRTSSLDAEPEPELFIPHAQSGNGSMTFVVRTAGNAAALQSVLRETVWSVDPLQTIYHEATVSELVRASIAARRFQLMLTALLAAVALVLVVLGLYGVLNLWVRQHMHEFGVRLALGAHAADIGRLLLRHALFMTLPGLALGLAGSALISRWTAHLLYGVQPLDALTFAGAAVVVAIVATLTAWPPARTAVRLDPVSSIRAE